MILPGVGSFSKGMENLNKLNLLGPIYEASSKGVPILGICLGMQLLADLGDEFGPNNGLGLINGRVTSWR